MFKVLALFALIAAVSAGYLEHAGLEIAAPAPAVFHAPAPAVYHAPTPVAYKSIVTPAVTKTDFLPGSYSSSYRSDVITPRVQYTETPGYSYSVPQPPAIAYAPTVTKVAHYEPVAPIIPALPVVEKYAHVAPAPLPLAHGELLGHGYSHGYKGYY
ncbi:extensin-1-like [Photinus pyralis]|uniref:extensin-1-like n=1 Tax=Photinus pyralis TaxID=7054 RepID=UPI001267440E|nr:extensin-1-like [Photinus pyralis]